MVERRAMRLLRLLGFVVLSLSLLIQHGPAAALSVHGHGHHHEHHGAGRATAAPCDAQEHAHHGTADPCDAHAALHGTACWGACCLASSVGAVPARGAKVEALARCTEEVARGSRSHALDPPPPRANA
jgi:hypothetical protein